MMGIRNRGERLPLWIQRLRSVDMLENAMKHVDHPLVVETMRECLEEAFDIPHAAAVLRSVHSGEIEVVERNTWTPSPFASELLFGFKAAMIYEEKAPHPGTIRQPFKPSTTLWLRLFPPLYLQFIPKRQALTNTFTYVLLLFPERLPAAWLFSPSSARSFFYVLLQLFGLLHLLYLHPISIFI